MSRIYDYRIREQVVRACNPDLFPHLEMLKASLPA